MQIYESVMGDSAAKPTTGLLTALTYMKDSRLLPHGFDKRTAAPEIAVHGEAEADPNFTAGQDTVRYSMATGDSAGPFQVEAELWYQPIGYRWAMNLNAYDAMETTRFLGYYKAAAGGFAVVWPTLRPRQDKTCSRT